MNAIEAKLWVETYRPRKLDDIVLPKKIKNQLKKFVEEGAIPTLLLSGHAGSGKTTVARALANEIGCDFYMINGSKDGNIDTLRTKIVNFASTASLENPDKPKIILIDEADYLNPSSTQPALRGVIEEFWSNCRFVFTCNYKNRMIPALQSRCTVIDFSFSRDDRMQMMGDFMKRVMGILTENKITFDPEVLAQFIQNHFPDMRRTLNELHRYATSGTIDRGILKAGGDDILEEVGGFLKDKNFRAMRDWVDANESIDVNVMFEKLYDGLAPLLTPQSVPELILILDDYQDKATRVVNQRINMAACMTQIMSAVEFKAS